MTITAYDLAMRFVGIKEAAGAASNPMILAMLRLDDPSIPSEDVPWCSAWVNWVAWLLRLPRSKSLAARSWLAVGTPITLAEARPGFDVVVLKRGANVQAGHVGWFSAIGGAHVWILGGNQGDAVSLAAFPVEDVVGVRRLTS